MGEFFEKHGAGAYLAVNAAFLIVIALSSTLHGDSGVNVVYLVLLLVLCTAPLAVLDGLNGRYVLLAIFMAFFFLFFGMLDLARVVLGIEKAQRAVGMTAAQWGILLGGACALIGYSATVRRARPRGTPSQSSDWPPLTILAVGLAVWLIGAASIIYFRVYVVPEQTNAAAARGLASMGPILTFIVMLGNLLAPLGTLILAYGYARYRTLLWLVIMLAVLAAQFVIAFVTNIRGLALIPLAIVIVAQTLLNNRLPKTWIIGAVAAGAVAFPILTAYRATIAGERGLSRAQAVENLGQVWDEVIAYRDRIARSSSSDEGLTLFDRAWLEDNVERLFEHTGVDVPFQHGATLVAIPLAFIPRVIWPDKPDVAVPVGQLFNHQFFGGTDDTYISPSQLGELYWNFGWTGVVAGMLLIGMLLGFVATRTDLSERFSVTRVLILLVTVQYLCWGFEGDLDAYVSWMRSLAVIGMLHLMFARPIGAPRVTATRRSDARAASGPPALPAPRFPNILM